MKRPSRDQVQIFETAAEFRRWLSANHALASEAWVGRYKKGVPKASMSYREAVDEALCYGWIDSTGYRIDDEVFAVRFTPRRRGSNWTEANVDRVGQLIADGRMHASGLTAFESRQTS